MKKKILIITGSRAEYGLLKNLIKKTNKDKNLCCKVIVTGSHLLSAYGYTYKEIIDDNIKIFKKIKSPLKTDTDYSVAKATGIIIISFSKLFDIEKPTMIVILGDRYEIFAAATAANFLKIPIFHISGGDSTLGVIDESLRHSITKMSYVHLVSSAQSKKRVIHLGENPSRVFNVGSLGTERV